MTDRDFIEQIVSGAQAGWDAYSILPSVTIAQAILESGWGQSDLATQAKNLFGIKASDDWSGETMDAPTKEWAGGQYVTVSAPFRKYASWSESVKDHARFFSSTIWRKRNYRRVIGERDYRKAAEALQAAGYATAPDYAEKLIRLIEQYHLDRYDEGYTEEEEKGEHVSNYQYITEHNAQNFTPGRQGHPIKYIVIHHWGERGQTFEGVLSWFCSNPSCHNSAHYVAEDGRVACVVDLENTAWHAGNWTYNLESIGIECRPEATDGDYETVGELVADLWRYYGRLPLIRHMDVPGASTACPGVWDIARIEAIAERYYSAAHDEKKETPMEEKPKIQQPSEWAEQTWKQAKAMGLCDGTRPLDVATREETVIMIMRALEMGSASLKKEKDPA